MSRPAAVPQYRYITINYTPPSPVGTFLGVSIYVQEPDQSQQPLDGSGTLDGTAGLGGAGTPLAFGPYADAEVQGTVQIKLPEPTAYPMTCRLWAISYSATGTNTIATSPSTTFVIRAPGNPKPGSATPYTHNPKLFTAGAVTPLKSVTGAGGKLQPVAYSQITVTETAPDNDPTFQGVVYVILDADGAVYWESTPQTASTVTLTFPTPGSVGAYTLYACGWDGTNINPIVPGITPSWPLTLGTTSGTVDGSQLAHVASGLSTAAGQLAIAYGLGLADDGSGSATVVVTGPLFKTVLGLDMSLAADFVVTGGQLNVATINLAKAVGYDTGTNGSTFSTASGALVLTALAVNNLIAGTALFTGPAIFASSSGPRVIVGSAGITMQDAASPTTTLTVNSTGLSVVKGSYSVATTASGTTIQGPLGSLTSTSGGITITNTNVSCALLASTVQLIYSGATNPTTFTMTSAGLSCYNNANQGILLTTAQLTLSDGTNTVKLNPSTGLSIYNSTASVNVTSSQIQLLTPGNASLTMTSGSLVVQSGSTYKVTVSSSQVKLEDGTNTVTLTPGGGLVLANGTNTVTVASGGLTLVGNGVSMYLGTFPLFGTSAVFQNGGTATYITGNQISCGPIFCSSINALAALFGGITGGVVQINWQQTATTASTTAGGYLLPALAAGFWVVTFNNSGTLYTMKFPFYAN